MWWKIQQIGKEILNFSAAQIDMTNIYKLGMYVITVSQQKMKS